MQNLVEFVHFKKYIYSWKINTKSDVLKKLYEFLITYCKNFHPKSPLYEKVKVTTKRTAIFKSFVIVGSFHCDCTQKGVVVEGGNFKWQR
jgi:hypothetical protein